MSRAEFTNPKHISRAARPEELNDLLEHPPRASIAFDNDGVIEAAPVALRFRDGRYWVGIRRSNTGSVPKADDRARLLIDDGRYHTELRGMWVRGRILPAEHRPEGASGNVDWFEVLPEKVVAWNYGAMREAKRR
jgi:hypothetical protein